MLQVVLCTLSRRKSMLYKTYCYCFHVPSVVYDNFAARQATCASLYLPTPTHVSVNAQYFDYLLQELASRAADLETQAARVSAELAEYKAESKELKNQEITIRRLEERIRSLESEVAMKDLAVDSAHAEAAAVLEARSADEAREREARLEAELHRTEAALEAVRRMHQATQSQLFSVQERGEEAAAAARAEAEYAIAEVERAQSQLALLAQERDALLDRMRVQHRDQNDDVRESDSSQEKGGLMDAEGSAAAAAAAAGMPPTSAVGAKERQGSGRGASSSLEDTPASAALAQASALREELRAQRDLASRVQNELSAAVRKAESEASTAVARYEGAQARLQASEARISALEAELAGRPTRKELEEARQKVRVLSAVFHNVVGEEDDEDDEQGERNSNKSKGDAARESSVGSKSDGGKTTSFALPRDSVIGSLETALLAKNRHLEHTLTMARLEAADARSAAETASSRVAELEGELERQQALVAKLEEDLVIASERVAGLGDGVTAGGDQEEITRTTARGEPASGTEDGRGGGQQEGDGEVGGSALPPTLLGNIAGGVERTSSLAGAASSGVGEATMLNILSAQRDRLRARVAELEGQVAAGIQRLSHAQQELSAAKSDNLSLVERLRYVQGYAGAQRAASTSQQDLESGSGVVNRYMREYEDKVVNPLSDFRKREREARQRALPLQDRAAVAVGSALVTGSRAARSAIMVYAVALHMMAFIVLAGFSHRHVDRLDQLEELCAGLHPLDASGVTASQNDASGGVATVAEVDLDPVMGGGATAAARGALGALRRLLMFL
jgi:homeobox protein cut-like